MTAGLDTARSGDCPVEVISAASPRMGQCLNPLRAVAGLWRHRGLIRQLAWRQLRRRCQGSILGFTWPLVLPLVCLAVCTFVFVTIFHVPWGAPDCQSPLEFALSLFCGLIFFNVFAEIVGTAPRLVPQAACYAKQTVFPLEILPLVNLAQVLLRAAVSLLILLAAVALWGKPAWTIPLVLLPAGALLLMSLGVAWLLAALGVFLRGLPHAVAILLPMLFFLTPIVYPLSAVPEPYRNLLLLNPLASLVEMARGAVLWGQAPDGKGLAVSLAISLVVFQAGYAFFIKSKRALADVV